MAHEEIEAVVREIKPVLMREAKKIKRPVFIDEEDLVQEALINIFSNIDSYNSDLSSIKTWCVNIARHKFYNVAKDYYRKKRSPKNENNENIFPEMFDENCSHLINEDPSAFDLMHENELVQETRKRVHNDLSKKIFDVMVSPTPDLINLVNERDKKQSARVKRVNSESNSNSKEPKTFHISNEDLACYFGVKSTAVIRAKDKIRIAIRSAVAVCEGNV
jgi:RNA polymerase sigma factor (sigma-70 family)